MWSYESIHVRSPDDTQMSLQILKRALRVCLLSHRHTDFSDSCPQPHYKPESSFMLLENLYYVWTHLASNARTSASLRDNPYALHDFPASSNNAITPCTHYRHDCSWFSTAIIPCTDNLQCQDLGKLRIACLRHACSFQALYQSQGSCLWCQARYNVSSITRYMFAMSGTLQCVANNDQS